MSIYINVRTADNADFLPADLSKLETCEGDFTLIGGKAPPDLTLFQGTPTGELVFQDLASESLALKPVGDGGGFTAQLLAIVGCPLLTDLTGMQFSGEIPNNLEMYIIGNQILDVCDFALRMLEQGHIFSPGDISANGNNCGFDVSECDEVVGEATPAAVSNTYMGDDFIVYQPSDTEHVDEPLNGFPGDVILDGNPEDSEVPLTVEETIAALSVLDGFDSIGGMISISNSLLTTFVGTALEGIKKIGGILQIARMPNLQNLNGLSPEVIGGRVNYFGGFGGNYSLVLTANPQLADISALNSVIEVNGGIAIDQNAIESMVDAFPLLDRCDKLAIENENALTTMHNAFQRLNNCPVRISSCPELLDAACAFRSLSSTVYNGDRPIESINTFVIGGELGPTTNEGFSAPIVLDDDVSGVTSHVIDGPFFAYAGSFDASDNEISGSIDCTELVVDVFQQWAAVVEVKRGKRSAVFHAGFGFNVVCPHDPVHPHV